MGSDWRPSLWGDEISLEYGKALRNYDTGKGKFRVYGSNGPIGWTDSPLANGPGVILGRKGAYRGVEYSKEPFFVIDTAYYVVPKREFDLRWLYYAIKHYKLGEIDDGSPIPSTTRAAVYVKDLLVPPITEQKAIAHVLGALDDKIELNYKTNETLESMTRALYKSWFIDFDPVRAKMDGRWKKGQSLPGLPMESFDLFPDKLFASNDLEIPNNWPQVALSELADVKHGFAFLGEYFSEEPTNTVLITPGNFSIGGGFKTDKLKFYNGPYQPEHVFSEGDLVITMTDLSKAGDTLGYPAFIGPLEKERISLHNQRVGKVIPKKTKNDLYFIYHTCCTESYRTYILGSATGSTVRHTSPDRILAYTSAMPPPDIRRIFGEVISPFHEKQRAIVAENYSLIELRNTLLTRLVSGELRIQNANEFNEERSL